MMDFYEKKYLNEGYKFIAGCDEVGRGPIAGPLVCAAVVLNPDKRIEGLDDSKKLTEKKRELLYDEIIAHALAYAFVFIDEESVDQSNVYQASKKGMIEAVNKLGVRVDFILSDAMPLDTQSVPYLSLIKGDQKSMSIAAASIIAKVTRDRHMKTMAKKYPHYGFDKHKGYPTKAHIEALHKYGPCEIHRKSFHPVKSFFEYKLF